MEFRMPSLGADMEAGTLVEWRAKPGDALKRGDIIAVVETQKGAIEIEVFEEGILEAQLVAPGAVLPVGAAMARISGEGKSAPAAAPSLGQQRQNPLLSRFKPQPGGQSRRKPVASRQQRAGLPKKWASISLG